MFLAGYQLVQASIIFDDFNSSQGSFNSAPNSSGTTTGLDTSNSAFTWDTTPGDSFEGAGANKLHIVHTSTTSSSRIRWLTGGGTPANNISFTTTAGTDGDIGLYIKSDASAAGWNVMINLDSSANTSATMWGSSQITLQTDGQWHLYEWSLDSSTWGTIPGIVTQTTGPLANQSWTIDSVYFIHTGNIAPAATTDIYADFVAKSDSGSIATLVPEPSVIALGLLGGLGILLRRATSRT